MCVNAAGFRFFVRALGQNLNKKNKKSIAVYGAGEAGNRLLEALKWDPDYQIKFFIDDNTEITGQMLGGVPVTSFEIAKDKIKEFEINAFIGYTKRYWEGSPEGP